MDNFIFVYGANYGGKHGSGAAKDALNQYGAIYGKWGFQGRSYGIPTKDEKLNTLSLDEIKTHVDNFIQFAKQHPELTFKVTRIGCGLAGYKDHQIAPMFKGSPNNVIFFEDSWEQYR